MLAVLVLAHMRWARPIEESAPPAAQSAGYDRARMLLAGLAVKGWDRHTDYARYRFGEAWSDDVNVEFGHNGCTTRDDIRSVQQRFEHLFGQRHPSARGESCGERRAEPRHRQCLQHRSALGGRDEAARRSFDSVVAAAPDSPQAAAAKQYLEQLKP